MIPSPLIPAPAALRLLARAVFLDARAGLAASESYEASHLRGARRVDLEKQLSQLGDPSVGGRHPLPSLATWLEQLGRWGIGPSTPVLIYDAGGGGMAAARAWWMLRAIGHQALAVVDGGWQALCELGAPTETETPSFEGLDPYPTELADWPSVDADFVERIRSDPSWRLLDARAPARFQGRSEPLDPVAGHIPGARNQYWQSQLSEKGTFEPSEALRERYARVLDGVPPERLVCYCGSGVTACHLLLALEAAGLSGARLYVGSWSEWCRQERPLATE